MISHQDARTLVREAFLSLFGREPTRPEAQFAQATSLHETGYGQLPPFTGSHNMGALQAHANWRGKTINAQDTRPNADGTSTPYKVKFRAYDQPIDGMVDFLRVLYRSSLRPNVLQVAGTGDARAFSLALYATPGRRYYESFGRTDEERVANHQAAIHRALVRMAHTLDEPMPDGSEPPPPVLRLGASGKWVLQLQGWLGLHAPRSVTLDGKFGPKTLAAVQSFQRDRGLKPDGIVGPATWAALK